MIEISGLDEAGPFWIDTVHHVCVFSVLYEFAAYLVRQRGYRRLVLLHQGQRPEPRLALCSRLMQERHAIPWTYIQFNKNWFSQLAKLTTPDTAIFYLVDMPREFFGRAASRQRALSFLQLHTVPDISIRMKTLSGSEIFARRLMAAHVVLDYPQSDGLRVRPYDATNPLAYCSLEDWAFGPLLDVHGSNDAVENDV